MATSPPHRAWALLAAAVLSEVTGSLSMRAAVERPAWYLVVAVAYTAALLLLSAVLRSGMPLGVAYGIWGALGVMLTALGGAVLFGEAVTAVMVVGIVCVVAGVVLVESGGRPGHGGPAGAAGSPATGQEAS